MPASLTIEDYIEAMPDKNKFSLAVIASQIALNKAYSPNVSKLDMNLNDIVKETLAAIYESRDNIKENKTANKTSIIEEAKTAIGFRVTRGVSSINLNIESRKTVNTSETKTSVDINFDEFISTDIN